MILSLVCLCAKRLGDTAEGLILYVRMKKLLSQCSRDCPVRVDSASFFRLAGALSPTSFGCENLLSGVQLMEFPE
ncbi:hypothetical protein M2275_001204 [Rhodococcus opacus]|nr:hypothetical protein [Rhodococcus opacus]